MRDVRERERRTRDDEARACARRASTRARGLHSETVLVGVLVRKWGEGGEW